MPFDRIDTLILRHVPRKGQEWTHYPIHDSHCIDENVTQRAEPHPFDIAPHPIDPSIYPDYEI